MKIPNLVGKRKSSVLIVIVIAFVITNMVFFPEDKVQAAADVYVDNYGAMADDGIDDGQAIRAAIQAAVDSGPGSRVLFSSGKYNVEPPPRSWEFESNGDLEGWVMQQQVSGSVTNGSLTLTISGSDPYIWSQDYLSFDSNKLNTIRIRMKNNTSSTVAQIYWITNNDTTWNATKHINFTINANDTNYTEYIVDLTANENWNNNIIRRIRIDPESAASTGSVDIDYIRMTTHPNVEWNFETDNDFEGWNMTQQVSGTVSEGKLNLTLTGIDPYINSPSSLDLTNQHTIVHIRMKNDSSSTFAQLFWITDTDTTYDSNKSIGFTTSANDDEYQEYTINLSTNLFWTGSTIRQIRFDPACNYSGSISIDYIRVECTPISRVYYNFLYRDIDNLSFIGDDTELNFSNPFVGGFSFKNSSNITFDGFTFDYENVPFVQGVASNCNATTGTFTFEPDDGYDLLDNPDMKEVPSIWISVRDATNPYLMKYTSTSFIKIKSWEKDGSTYTITVPDNFKQYINSSDNLANGDKIVINNRSIGGSILNCSQCSNVTLQYCTIYADVSGVIVASTSDNIVQDHIQVIRKPNSGRYISSNADCFHVQGARIGPTASNCTYEGVLDDIMNFYTLPLFIHDVVSNNKIMVIVTNNIIPLSGDTIQIFDPINGRIKGTATITQVDEVEGYSLSSRAYVTLNTSIPDMVAGNDFKTADSMYILDTMSPGFSVTDSIFRESRRYGLYIKAIDGTINGNTFSELAGSAIYMSNEPTYPEGLIASNIEINDNTITNCQYKSSSNSSTGAITGTSRALSKLADERALKNITVTNNTISGYSKNAICFTGADNVQITGNNTITNTSQDYTYSDSAGVRLQNVTNVTIDGLTMSDPRTVVTAGVVKGSFVESTESNLDFTLAAGKPDIYSLAPGAPSGLMAYAVSTNAIDLDWADTAGAVKYKVYRSTNPEFLPAWYNLIAANLTSSNYSDTDLIAGTAYYYKVTAINASGYESPSSGQDGAVPGGIYDWYFNVDDDLEGWTLKNTISGTVSNGKLNLTINDTDPYIWSENNLGLDASEYSVAKIRMKNNTSATNAQVYWITNSDTTYDRNKMISFSINANDSEYTEYVVNLNDNQNWAGTIKQFRVDPGQGYTGTVNIESIELDEID